MRRLLNVFVLILYALSCSSTTKISVSDKEAQIYTDDKLIGTGTAVYTDTKIIYSVTSVKLKKTGCEDVVYSFKKNEKFDWGAFVGGCVTLVPLIWVLKYKPNRDFRFDCIPNKNKASHFTKQAL